MNEGISDRIEKRILLHAPKSRVWRALTDAREFGTWFQVDLEGPFQVGRSVQGRVTYPGFEHLRLEVTVERIDAERLFSFRWHPHAVDPKVDYSREPTTLVEFRLEDAPGGVLLTVTESGFDRIPPSRRDEAFRMNSRGWEAQMGSIARHVDG
jgi:uncharacterized protein YndB with AHSA1/START domain